MLAKYPSIIQVMDLPTGDELLGRRLSSLMVSSSDRTWGVFGGRFVGVCLDLGLCEQPPR